MKVVSIKFFSGAVIASNSPEEKGVPGITVTGHFTPRYAAVTVLGMVDHPDMIVDVGSTRVQPAGWTTQQLQSVIETELAK